MDPGYHGNACRMPCGRGIRRDKGRACLFVRRVERETQPWSERKHKKEKPPPKHINQNALEQDNAEHKPHEQGKHEISIAVDNATRHKHMSRLT